MIHLPLTNGPTALLDDADGHLSAWKWFGHFNAQTGRYYVEVSLYAGKGKQQVVLLHHAVMGRPIDRRLVIDHINGDPLDNRRSNLRIVTTRGNMANQTIHRSGLASSQHIGVSLLRGRWQANIFANGKQHYLGFFKREADAAEAYRLALECVNRGEPIRRLVIEKPRRNTTSRFVGVCWHKREKRWRAQVNLNGRKIHLGSFIDEDAAARAYQSAKGTPTR